MPRPSIKAERTQDILDAFERCVARFGVEGSTLERIAEEAQLQRSLLRHYVGNKDDLLKALVDRFLRRARARADVFFDSLPDAQRVQVLIDALFDDSDIDTQFVLVAEALIAASPEHPHLRPRLRHWVEDFAERIAAQLTLAYPQATAEDCTDVASGLVGIYFNVDSLTPLGKMTKFRAASKRAALRLLQTLGD